MVGTGIIDQFLETFTRYIDSGFGLLGGEVGYLATTLAAIDITLAGLFWSWGADEDILARLVRKTLFVGVFAFLIGNWNSLARIIFESFAGLGLKASGTGLSSADFLRPGKIAQVGGRTNRAAHSDFVGAQVDVFCLAVRPTRIKKAPLTRAQWKIQGGEMQHVAALQCGAHGNRFGCGNGRRPFAHRPRHHHVDGGRCNNGQLPSAFFADRLLSRRKPLHTSHERINRLGKLFANDRRCTTAAHRQETQRCMSYGASQM